MEINRRNYLAATGGALLAASALGGAAHADGHDNDADTLYGHGMVWNRDLPGELGQLKLGFDLRVNLETGIGFGIASDPLHPSWDTHFDITSISVEKVKNERRYTMKGIVIDAADPNHIGLPVRILAETRGDTTAIAIAVGDTAFGGAGLVVIAIIAVLIALLVPAVQKVR